MRTTKIDSWGRPVRFKHSYNLEVFRTKNALFYYLLGAFITDGNVYIYRDGKSAKTSLSSKDIDWLRAINKFICDDDLISIKKNGQGTLGMFDPTIADLLINSGCHPRKSLTVRLPNVPDKYLRDFLRGCIDGDGSISQRKAKVKRPYGTYHYDVSSCYLCSASKSFLLDISKELHKLGFKHYFITLKPKTRKIRGEIIKSVRPMYRLLFNNNDCKKFLQWIYYPDHAIAMQRKATLSQAIVASTRTL